MSVDMTFWVWFGGLLESRMIHYYSLSSRQLRTAKLVIRFEVRSFYACRGYSLKYSHIAIPAKLHCPKGDWINESLVYMQFTCRSIINSRRVGSHGL